MRPTDWRPPGFLRRAVAYNFRTLLAAAGVGGRFKFPPKRRIGYIAALRANSPQATAPTRSQRQALREASATPATENS
jgi:hypothetical protein